MKLNHPGSSLSGLFEGPTANGVSMYFFRFPSYLGVQLDKRIDK